MPSSLSHFTVVKDHFSTVSLRMPAMYFGDPAPRSPSLSPTDVPHVAAPDIESTSGLPFSTPSTQQADAWACSLLNLSPSTTQCDHADSSCDCWQDPPASNTTISSHEPTGLPHSQAPSTNNSLDPRTASTGGSNSSSQSCSGSSTKHERSSEPRTRETSYASAEDVEPSRNKP